MILCDTSVWVDWLKNRSTRQTEELDYLLETEDLIHGDLVVVEVLQGIRLERDFRWTLALFQGTAVETLCGPGIAPLAARNYRALRQEGVTIRCTIDVVIATWCIENDVALLHNDRDFAVLEDALGLKAV